MGDLDPLYLSEEMGGDARIISINMVVANMTLLGDKFSAIDVWPNYSMDASIQESGTA